MSDNPTPSFPNMCNLCKPCCAAMVAIGKHLQQPSSVAGLAALVGIASAYGTGQMTGPQAVPAVVGALAAILFPDNSTAKAEAMAMATAAMQSNTNRIAAVEGHPALLTPTGAKP